MRNSELPTIDYPRGRGFRDGLLVEAPAGRSFVVIAVAEGRGPALGQEGIVPGAEIVVEKRLPLGGPVIVRVRGARLALARGVARDVSVGEARR